jgi:hypothetical protein
MNKPRLVYVPREDATPEGELAALVAAYRYVLFQRREVKRAAGVSEGEEAAGLNCAKGIGSEKREP